ncbi:hypothetical protein A6R68_00833 [Neotoma lepida]|uniref:Uncharacterized protein n=1 Tax=Neotoma lepida TaxID=56216 RepID=A0A1A6GWV0_NEOLE|nr:hypothetical protein A6R68_00833 [Neotoma lepida]
MGAPSFPTSASDRSGATTCVLKRRPAVLSLMPQMPPTGFQDCNHSDANSAEWIPVVTRSSDQTTAMYRGHPCASTQSMASE